jgi:hypothetical protein
MFSHQNMINVLVVQNFFKAGEEGKEDKKDLIRKEGKTYEVDE